jgi:hypothetical protein
MTVPPLRLEQLSLGEGSPSQIRATRERLGAEAESRLAALHADNADILRRYPPRVVALEIHNRQRNAKIRRWTPMIALATVGAVAAAALVVVAVPSEVEPAGWTEEGVRLKGAVTLLVHRRTVDGDQKLPEGASARPGDQLQLEIQPAQADHAVLVSLDGRGKITRHLPLAGDRAVPVDPGQTVALPNAYQLDDAPSFERFFLVVGRGPFELGPVERAAATLAHRPDRGRSGDLPLPAHFAVDSHLVVKETP